MLSSTIAGEEIENTTETLIGSLKLVIFIQVIHRSFAALLAAFIAMGTLAALNDRPTMFEIVNWMDSETLLLIFSMMILVGILMDTGIFDYIAVYVFKVGVVNFHKRNHSIIMMSVHVHNEFSFSDKQW